MSNQPVIVAAKRTPVGRFFGSLAKVPTPQIGAFAIEAVLNDAPAAKDHVDECIMGCVLQAGLGQNPARQAGLKAGLPSTLSAKTINKVCGSGLEAVMLAAQSIKAGDNDCVVAGGMENMTGSPHFTHVRQGVKYGPGTLEDHMAYDGLRCAFECWPMGNAAEHIADKYGITREDQDRFGAQSHIRAAAAWDAGHFDAEVVTLTGEQALIDLLNKAPHLLDDETGSKIKSIKITAYEPAFGIIGDPAKRNPTTRQSADHSMVYIVATLLRKALSSQKAGWKDLMLEPYDYSADAIANERTRSLMEKIEFFHGGEDYDKRYPDGIPTSLIIEDTDGTEFDSGMVMYPAGHARNTEADLKDILAFKFNLLGKLAFENPEPIVARFENLGNKSAEDIASINDFEIQTRDGFE